MNRTEVKEIWVGAVVVFLLCGLVYSLNMQPQAMPNTDDQILLSATFNHVDGLEEQAEIRMSGVQIGTVVGRSLDENYRVVVHMAVDPTVDIPTDTSAAIHTDGIFGGKFIELEPGGDYEFMAQGGEFDMVQSSVVVEDLLDLIISQGKARQASKNKNELSE